MTRGLVIGKFMPVHAGHIAMIRFAASLCDELIVSMSFTPDDPIDGALRFSWLAEIVSTIGNVKPFMIVDDFDDPLLPMDERTRRWAEEMGRIYPTVDLLISSESYGEPFAHHLKARHVSFDPGRINFPVSATQIRNQPFRYWEFIPLVVRPYFVKNICIYGPESTGKSTLAIRLAAHFHTEFVPEVAREMLINNDFGIDDIIRIGIGQTERVVEKRKHANKLLFCDTDLITTQIYSQHYLGVVPEILYTLESQVQYDHYFLLQADTPWIADGLRDLGHRRDEMYTTFKEALDRRKITYTIINGNWAQRERIATDIIEASYFTV